MKSIITFAITLLLFQINASSQSVNQVVETPKILIINWQNSYTAEVASNDATMIERAWSTKMKEHGGVKVETATVAVGYKTVMIPTISAEPLQIFFKTYTDQEKTSYVTIWLREGNRFISSKNKANSKETISRFLNQFVAGLNASSSKLENPIGG